MKDDATNRDAPASSGGARGSAYAIRRKGYELPLPTFYYDLIDAEMAARWHRDHDGASLEVVKVTIEVAASRPNAQVSRPATPR